VTITLVNRTPVTSNSAVTLPLGAAYQGYCVATNPDCLNQTLRYSVVTPPTKGNLNAFNTNTGLFTYSATLGQSGADSFVFQVSDGVSFAAQPGTFTLNLVVGPPSANPASIETQIGLPFHGTLTETDPNLPIPPLTFSVVSQGTLGTAVITNAGSGGFTYTPAAGRFGSDNFSFKVNNGSDSPPATVSVSIRPRGLAQGNVLLSDFQQRLVAMLHPVNGDMVVISKSNLLALPTGISYEPRGTILVNWVGSLLLGFFSGLGLTGHTIALLGTGFCGGLTTYSSFAVQAHDRGRAYGSVIVVATIVPALLLCGLGFLVGAQA